MKQKKQSNKLKIGGKNKLIILDAAEKAFANNGFKGTSVQQIADAAGLPKTNILYYFKSKQELYTAVLRRTMSLWNSKFDHVTADDDPAEALAAYITEKMETSRTYPLSSKIFAMEIIIGAPNMDSYFDQEHAKWMENRVDLINQWIEKGKIKTLNPHYLLYQIWASTQHYADFSTQINRLRGKNMKMADFHEATKQLIDVILTGCGLSVPSKYK